MSREVDPATLTARLLSFNAPGVLFFDGGHTSVSWVLCSPVAVCRERDDRFFVGEEEVEPMSWMVEHRRTEGLVAGLLGYELGELLHGLSPRRGRTPKLWVGAYSTAARYDPHRRTWTVVGDESSPGADALATALAMSPRVAHRRSPRRGATDTRGNRITMVGGGEGVDQRTHYEAKVARAVVDITAGEMFEVNYTERFRAPSTDPWAVYTAMRNRASGQHFSYLDGGDFAVASVSPEQFMRIDRTRVVVRPIKGSRPRAEDPAVDASLREALRKSEKDRAENIMIVDLMRNDLTRVCRIPSVEVTQLCEVESFAGIHHLVSTVTGELAAGVDPIEALVACFPAGSITGAPKLRAMEWIAEHEASPRGAYTGSLFYATDTGQLDASVLIRTAEWVDGVVDYGAGGAVTAQSEPKAEYEEARLKRRVFDAAMGGRS